MSPLFSFFAYALSEVSQVSQTPMALGQHGTFEVSQRPPVVHFEKGRKPAWLLGL